MKVRTLKRAAGAVNFEPNRIIDLPDELVASFVAAGAVELVESSVVVEKVEAKQDENDPSKWNVEVEFATEPEPVESERPRRKRR